MSQETKKPDGPVEAEVVDEGFAGATAAALVRQGQALMRAENDSLMAVAAQRPRNEQRFMEGALAELTLYPEQAKTMFYSIPYKDFDRATGSVKIVRVEGPSIGAAMALARRWGNCTATARAVNEDDDGFDLEGVFIDLESNFRVAKAWRVAKTFRRRDGRTELLNAQRLGITIQAGLSKAMRNAILAGLPAGYVQMFYARAKEIAGGKADAPAKPEVVAAIVKAFDRLGLKAEQLEAYAEVPRAEWTGEDVANLRGLWNALNDKQVTVAEILQPAEAGGDLAPQTITPESLAQGSVESKDDPDRDVRKAAAPTKRR